MKRMMVLWVVAATASAALAEITLGTPFSDRAVLQREMDLPIWGRATPGSTVKVEFAGQTKTARADSRGDWKVTLEPLATSHENRKLTAVELKDDGSEISRKEVVDLLVGEVWFASGQSNMECPIWSDDTRYRDKKGKMMMSLATRPEIRFALMPRAWKKTPDRTVEAEWLQFAPDAFLAKPGYGFSAIAFYYALTLHDTLRVPIGIVEAAYGGTNIDAWTPRSAYATHPELKAVADWQLRDRWTGSMTTGAISDLIQQPTVLWNGMVAGWAPMAMRGMIWYQGCSNNCESYNYADKMHALYDGWAKEFENPELKLYFVELAPYRINWFQIQMEQAKFAAAEKNAGMVTTCDIGNWHDIHPNDKEPVARRLALLALKRDYGFEEVQAEAPTLKDWKVEDDHFVLTFNHAKSWYFHKDDWSHPDGFQVAGADGVWQPAKLLNKLPRTGILEGEALLVGSDKVKAPKVLRYLAAKPWAGWLYAAESALPLGPFKIDTRKRSEIYRGKVAHLGAALAIPELEGYRRVYAANLPSNGKFADTRYELDASSEIKEFSRIAYVLELEHGDGSVKWVVTAMDAFTNDVTKVGVPALTNGAVFNQKINNLTVRSNLKTVTEVTDYDGGSIEMYNCNYYTWTDKVVPGGRGDVFDFNDLPIEPTKPGCGAMQVHDWKRGVTLWAYNDFNSWNKTNSIGIGYAEDEEHPDFSYADNAGRYRLRRLTILVK